MNNELQQLIGKLEQAFSTLDLGKDTILSICNVLIGKISELEAKVKDLEEDND